MVYLRLSDLQTKDIISTKDGRKLGRIIDVEIENDGRITYLVVEQKKKFKTLIGGGMDVSFNFTSIVKIGEDVILIDV